MHLAFIGMSGVGKSYWAKQLAQPEWMHFDCDYTIGLTLRDIAPAEKGEERVHAVGRWMDMPWSDGYPEREAQYLDLESSLIWYLLNKVEYKPERKCVIDTTGSVIYTGDEQLKRLKQLTRVVYFDVPDTVRDEMVALYLREPKPVLWRGMYQPRPGESQDDALSRCYAELLADRAERYRALADVVLDYHALREPGVGVPDILKMIDLAV